MMRGETLVILPPVSHPYATLLHGQVQYLPLSTTHSLPNQVKTFYVSNKLGYKGN